MILAKQKSEEAKEKADVEQDLFSDMAPTIKRWPTNRGQYLVSLYDVQAEEDIYWRARWQWF